MGATKRASEIFCQTYNLQTKTKFMTVRFGNVLNSAGSVIPLFRQQLLSGGPITVTHPDITRYFMTIPEASQLILQAATIAEGDIFVLDMGEPININYLAEQMVKLSGKEIGKDIEIKYTGLRAGEKLHEELLYENENICNTSHPQIKQANVQTYEWNHIIHLIDQIEHACLQGDEVQLKKLLCRLVPEYRAPENAIQQKTSHPTLAYV
jgi:FlaA1/EpsC-like NDP-sugar epimerase